MKDQTKKLVRDRVETRSISLQNDIYSLKQEELENLVTAKQDIYRTISRVVGKEFADIVYSEFDNTQATYIRKPVMTVLKRKMLFSISQLNKAVRNKHLTKMFFFNVI